VATLLVVYVFELLFLGYRETWASF